MDMPIMTGRQVEARYPFTRAALYHAARRGDIAAPIKMGSRTMWNVESVENAYRTGKIRANGRHKRVQPTRAPIKHTRSSSITMRADYEAILEDIGRNLHREKTAGQIADEYRVGVAGIYRLAITLREHGVAIPDAMTERVNAIERVAAKIKSEQARGGMSAMG